MMLLMLVVVSSAFAQNDLLTTANKNYELKSFKKAIVGYQELLKKYPNNITILAKLGDCYRHTNNPSRAADYYRKAVVKSSDEPIHILNYGKVLMQLEQYDEAKKWFGIYSQKDPVTGKQFVASCDFAKRQKASSALFKPQREYLNTADADFAPAFFGKRIIYASSRTDIKNKINNGGTDWTGEPKNQLFVTGKDRKGRLQRPSILKKSFLAKSNEGPLSFTGNYKKVAYTKNNFVNGVRQLASSGLKLRILIADLKSEAEWEKIKPFPYNGDDFSTGYPHISADGQTLYFASDRPGGMGGFDIYVSYYRAGKWSEPQNLGKGINTPGDEISPYVDGRNIYFASNWHKGFGGYDIFRGMQINRTWGNVSNVGKGINSPRDDFGFIYDSKSDLGYFVSNRAGGKGNEDIYAAKRNVSAPMPKPTDKPVVVKPQPTTPRGGFKDEIIELSVLNSVDNTPVSRAILDFTLCGADKYVADNSGVYEFQSVGGLDCKVTVSKEGYEPKTVRLVSKNGDTRTLEVFLKPIDDKYYGLVVDDNTNKPLSGVKIMATNVATNVTASATSTDEGRYGLNLDAYTDYLIKYSKSGYQVTKINVKSGDGSDRSMLGIKHLMPLNNSGPATDIDDELPGVAYEVKIGAFKNANPAELIRLNRYGNVYSEPAGAYKRYKVGAFASKKEAEEVKARIIKDLGLYKDAVITKTSNRQLIREVLLRTDSEEGTIEPPGGLDKKKFTPEPNPIDIPNVVVYKVQLGAYSNPKYFNRAAVENLGMVETKVKTLASGKKVTIFLLGNFASKAAADRAKTEVVKRGIKQAFVVAYKNGEKMK